MDDVYRRDFTVYAGSDFSEIITFSEIYVDISETGNYTLVAGMKLKSDTTIGHELTAEIVADTDNAQFSLGMTLEQTTLIPIIGDYYFAVDLNDTDLGTTSTVFTGTITVKEDISNV